MNGNNILEKLDALKTEMERNLQLIDSALEIVEFKEVLNFDELEKLLLLIVLLSNSNNAIIEAFDEIDYSNVNHTAEISTVNYLILALHQQILDGREKLDDRMNDLGLLEIA